MSGQLLDNAFTERQNILKISEYSIKETINVFLSDNFNFENDSSELNQFLSIIENIFLHQIKRSTRNCWKLIYAFTKSKERYELLETIINLPHVKTNIGRLRAWIRLSLMQKNFSETFAQLAENKLFLSEYYEPTAFMLNEEAQIFSGLLLSLNFIDYNFCLREMDLDNFKFTIDVGRYMKIASLETFPLPVANKFALQSENFVKNESIDNTNTNYSINNNDGNETILNNTSTRENGNSFDQTDSISLDSSRESKLTDILDQKHYLEELNKHHNQTINEYKDKYAKQGREIESLKRELNVLADKNLELETANSLLIANFEKPSSCKNNFNTELQNNSTIPSINTNCNSQRIMRRDQTSQTDYDIKDLKSQFSSTTHKVENEQTKHECQESLLKSTINELKQQLLNLKADKLKYEHLYQTCSRKADDALAKLGHLEKSDAQKSHQILDQRRQLDDLKAINAEMYTKIENYEASLKHKHEIVNRLEQKNRSISTALKDMEEKYDKLLSYQSSTEDIFGKMERELTKKDQIREQLENELKMEREAKIALQTHMHRDKMEFSRRLKEISKAEDVLKNNEYLHKKNEELTSVLAEQEKTLTELGIKIKETTLETDNLKDTILPYLIPAKWQKDDEVSQCPICNVSFTPLNRKHHCRNCGKIFCKECSRYKIETAYSSKPVRVCQSCLNLLQNKSSPLIIT